MVIALDSPQPVYVLPPLFDIPDTDEDRPKSGLALREVGVLSLPEIVFGAASFSGFYNGDDHLTSTIPVRTVRLALRYGINVFDTSPYYGPSEIVLGTALKTLEPNFPRSSYRLMTKCGRFGPKAEDFDYSPRAIRACVKRSLERFHTNYLDAVYLHDVEFVCASVQPRTSGNHIDALSSEKGEYGLLEGHEANIRGPGDQIILDAIAELRKMKEEGIVNNIGITGYPLPTLLRLALLVSHTAPFEPLDVILSYSHLNLQNETLSTFLPHFRERAHVKQLVAASPINMGLLTPSPPKWHPASEESRDASRLAHDICVKEEWAGGLVDVALGFAYRRGQELELPTVVGLSQPREVHENIQVWRALQEQTAEKSKERTDIEGRVLGAFKDVQGWSWASP